MNTRTILYSPRGLPLVWGGGHLVEAVVLTVECCSKWYELFLIFPDKIVGVDYSVIWAHCKDESPCCDHAPNPKAVARYAAAHGYHLDEQAFEMMIGRWELAYRGTCDSETEDSSREVPRA